MDGSWVEYLMLCAAVGCGSMGGVFFAFSTFVMPALARLPASQGIAAMQSINITAITPLFMGALFGTAAACGVLTVHTFRNWQSPDAVYVLAGSLLYLVGTILVTIVCNVPRNNALAVRRPDDAESARLWPGWFASWIAWNHVRTVTALAAAGLLTLALATP